MVCLLSHVLCHLLIALLPILALLICAFQELIDLTIAEVILILIVSILVNLNDRLGNLLDLVKWLS